MPKIKTHNHQRPRGFPGIRVDFFPGTKIPDFMNFSLPGPWTHGDKIRKIAEPFGVCVAPLPPQLEATRHLRPGSVFGSASKELVRIAENYPNMDWAVANGVLSFFEVRTDDREPLSDFDELAGRLMLEAPRVNGRIPKAEYRRIMAEIDAVLDKAGSNCFKPIRYLEGEWRVALGDWNTKHSKDGKAHHTFLSAYLDPQFKEGVRRRLNRAQAKYRKTHPDA